MAGRKGKVRRQQPRSKKKLRVSHKKVMLPLLNVLRNMTADHRQILLAHLDDKTRDGLYETISHVLRSNKVPFAKRLFLKSKLSPYKKDLRYLSNPKRTGAQKRKRLTQVGAGPMSHILKAAIPLLLNLFPK